MWEDCERIVVLYVLRRKIEGLVQWETELDNCVNGVPLRVRVNMCR